jgi:type VI protein secretion system component VasA
LPDSSGATPADAAVADKDENDDDDDDDDDNESSTACSTNRHLPSFILSPATSFKCADAGRVETSADALKTRSSACFRE